ncbi:MAG: nucleotidyl transferase AbiEii/AbiGii toxin family protein [bacterium]
MQETDKKYFTKENIEKNRLNASAILAEQAVHCLELVSQLVNTGLSFQFKGGNSLLLILEKPQRFSIDVDIATDEPREKIESSLDKLINRNKKFIRWEKRHHKTKPNIPISSYYLYYKSRFTLPEETNIMLDVQLRRSPYKTELKKVECGELYRSAAKAELPLPSSIIGDKLLTMGPETLGIPIGKKKQAQRLKHVFDVSVLLDTNPLLSEIRRSLALCLEQENSLQEKAITLKEVIDDTVAFCSTVALFNDKPELKNDFSPYLIENIDGFDPFCAHLFASDYSWNALQLDMARVALCLTGVGQESLKDEDFHEILTMKREFRESNFPWKDILLHNPRAGYYWSFAASWLERNPFK